MSALTENLRSLLSNATIMYHRVHGFHWNVMGADFPEWHEKFEEIYTDVYESLDPIAENIRKLGDIAPFRLEELLSLATVSDNTVADYAPETLVESLIETNNGVLESLKTCFATANNDNEQGVANFIAERIEMHQKWNWQLSASVEKSADAEITDWLRRAL